LNIWATWCKPCIEEMPSLNNVASIYSKNQVNFLSLSIDDDSVKLNKFLNSKKFKFNDITFQNLTYKNAILNFLEGKKTDAYISMKSVPKTYVIKNRAIIHKFEGVVDTTYLKAIIEKNL
jgi:thiol-disulfide isomerase/thioredoxin